MSTKTATTKQTTTTTTKKKTDPLLIVVIVLIILAIVFLIIAVAILFGYSGKPALADKKGQLAAAGAFFIIAAPIAIITTILISSAISKRKKGLPTANLMKVILVMSIIVGVFLLIASVITFVTANQVGGSDAAGVRAAGAFGLLAFLTYAVAFIIILVRGFKKQDTKQDGSYYGATKRGMAKGGQSSS